MSTTDEVITVVHELAPGLVFVKIGDPPPAPDRTEFLLRRTIENWFFPKPGFVIDRQEVLTSRGEMVGIHVWYHVDPEKAHNPLGPLANLFDTLEVHAKIGELHQKEYIEAVIADAMRVLPSYPDMQNTVVVVNRRRLAVAFDKQARRVVVVPVDFVEQVIAEPAKTQLHTWLAAPESSFHVLQIAGSWFSAK